MKILLKSVNNAFLGLAVLGVVFMTFEPAISFGAMPNKTQITISQVVSAEVGFSSEATNVLMIPTLGGISGGTAFGTTTFAVTSNSLTGYSVTIMASSTTGAMQGTASTTNYIAGYVPSSALRADYDMTVALNKTGFAYSVQASSTSDVAPLFRAIGTTCGFVTGAAPSAGHCWYVATSTAATIINRTLPTVGGAATSSVIFQVQIMSNPNPVIPNDTYVATTTLTVTMN